MRVQQLRRDHPSRYRLAVSAVRASGVCGLLLSLRSLLRSDTFRKCAITRLLIRDSTSSWKRTEDEPGARHSADNFVTFANCESRRPLAIRERGERGVATPVLCISSIHVAVSGTDPRLSAPLCIHGSDSGNPRRVHSKCPQRKAQAANLPRN